MVSREVYPPSSVHEVRPQVRREPSLGALFGELLHDTQKLLRQEVALAKSEVSQKASVAGSAVTYLAIGGFIAYAGFLAIVFAIIAALGLIMPVWLSALIVGLVVAIIGYLVLQQGLNNLKANKLVPHQTIQSLKETTEWAKEQI